MNGFHCPTTWCPEREGNTFSIAQEGFFLNVISTYSIVRAVETCAGRPPVVMGKPNPYICDAIVKAFNVVPERTLMIGDR
jgi:ribonucleotide monophosphatase NagD (HAD superfamily)